VNPQKQKTYINNNNNPRQKKHDERLNYMHYLWHIINIIINTYITLIKTHLAAGV